jgi:hypothetical protein
VSIVTLNSKGVHWTLDNRTVEARFNESPIFGRGAYGNWSKHTENAVVRNEKLTFYKRHSHSTREKKRKGNNEFERDLHDAEEPYEDSVLSVTVRMAAAL